MKKHIPRREFIKLATAIASVGPFFTFSSRAFSNTKTLRIAKWAHLIPEYDTWFSTEFVKQWGEKNNTEVIVELIPIERVHSDAAAEVAAGKGHDLISFPSPAREAHLHLLHET